MLRDWHELDEDELRELEEAEGEIPRGWQPGPETVRAIEGGPVGPLQDYAVVGDAGEKGKLVESLQRLETSDIGQLTAKTIREHGTAIRFDPMEQGAIAQFDSETNEITVNEGLKDASPNVLAAHLAHEGTHVQWNQPDSIDQEYHAFKAQAEVWNQLKVDETDRQCDWVAGMIVRGEKEAKEAIRRLYPDLPEYWR
jgi:hypothetical protein